MTSGSYGGYDGHAITLHSYAYIWSGLLWLSMYYISCRLGLCVRCGYGLILYTSGLHNTENVYLWDVEIKWL